MLTNKFQYLQCSYLSCLFQMNSIILKHQQNKKSRMIDFFQDRHILANSKKKTLIKNGLPQIKYSPAISRKLNQELLLPTSNIKLLYNYQPLSNILISKKITPPNPQQVTLFMSKKRPPQNVNLHNFKIRKESVKKMTDNQKQLFQSHEDRRNSTSLSHRSHRIQQNQIIADQHQQLQLKINKTTNQLTFHVIKGNNNEDLVREILLQRKIWKQVKPGEGVPNFKWVFYKDRHNYKKMWSFTKKRIINHFQFNEQISTKDQLVRNLQIYCETKKIQVFNITPITFIIDFDDEYCEYNIKQFLSFFQKNDPRKSNPKKGSLPANFVGKFQNYMAWQNSDIKKKVNILSRPINNNTYYSQNSYLWLLKPTGLNRGRGIQIFDSLEQLEKILLDYLALMNRKKLKQKQGEKGEKQQKNHQKLQDKTIDKQGKQTKQAKQQETKKQGDQAEDPSAPNPEPKFAAQKFKLNSCSFVIQKYVEKPFLIHDRKFDIRVWVLLTENMTIYFFKEAYLRTSAEAFSTGNIDNYFIHLTNNAIQKYSSNYGQFQNANQLSFRSLKEFMPQETVNNIWNRIKEITYMTFSSVKKKINNNQRKHCFEIFGLDFIIDSQHKVWLIQVNQNPCIECSSPLLGKLIPRMLNDAFKLTLDQIIDRKCEEKPYPVDGYPDNENMWENLGQLLPNSEYSSPKKR